MSGTATGVARCSSSRARSAALKHADLFPLAIGLSGNYDSSRWHAWGERGGAAYVNNPVDCVQHLGGEHLDWLRSRLSILLVVGHGAWETHPTGSLPGTLHSPGSCTPRGCAVSLTWWQRQLAHHLPRSC